MTKTIIALYDDFSQANDVVKDLSDEGFARENMSLMTGDPTGEYAEYLERTERAEGNVATESAGIGAGIGAVMGGLGGMLIGWGALVIPGLGPVIAAGPLAAALGGLAGAGVGAIAGGVAGGFLGALVDMGVPEQTAHVYAEGIRRGGTLVTIQTTDEIARAALDIMNRHNPVDVKQRATEWRQSGWTAFNPQAEPQSSAETRRVAEAQDEAVVETQAEESDDFSSLEPEFEHHFQSNYPDSEYTSAQFVPAYRYGYNLANNEIYREYDQWSDVEPDARRYWEEKNPGTWEEFKDAVRHAWQVVKDQSGSPSV
jgi:hypothetical protein